MDNREMGYSLALTQEGKIVMLKNASKNQRWPKHATILNPHMLIEIKRKDGLLLKVPIGMLVDSMAAIKSNDLEDLGEWLLALLETGVLNEAIPHARLGDLVNLINVFRMILIASEVDLD